MSENKQKQKLVERVLVHHKIDKPRDGIGGTISVLEIAELGEGVACVYDSLREFDIFFDVGDWDLADSGQGRYGIMLNAAREGILQYWEMRADYGMVCLVQDRWDPASYQGRSSFLKAHEAAKVLLTPKNQNVHLYNTPRVGISLD